MSELTRREIEKAISTDRDTYPRMIECEICGEIWMSHNGSLCPICSICREIYCRHVDSCVQCSAAVRDREHFPMCDEGYQLGRKCHALNHSPIPLPGRGLEAVQVREGAGVNWHLCHGGTTLFIPRLQCSTDFLN